MAVFIFPARDLEAGQTAKNGARLKRPWGVFIFGILAASVLVACGYTYAMGSGITDRYLRYGLTGVACLVVVMSAAYAFIGARYSLALARRIVGIIGLIPIAVGIGVLVWILSW